MRCTFPLALLLCACTGTPLTPPADDGVPDLAVQNGDGGSPDGPPDAAGPVRQPVELSVNTKIDLLIMMDNSSSMDAMQSELRSRFPELLGPLLNLAARGVRTDLHLGVVTSDYGAGAVGAPGCSPSPGGNGGRLQPIGAKASAACKKPINANYVQYVFDGGGAGANNLPPGQDLITTLACMSAVGSSGCGFEHQLESVYAALHNNLPDNAGFLRDDAVLVVLFVTNEDDASAAPDIDVFDKNRTAQYGFEDSYSRQTRFAVMCCAPGQNNCGAAQLQFPPYADSAGPLAGCAPSPNVPTGAGPGKQYDVHRYIDLFTKPAALGGLKANPNDVILFALDAPDAPFQVILSNPGTIGGQPYIQCPQLNEQSSPPCVPVLQHSYMNPLAPAFFGDPAVRLNTVVYAAANHGVASICDDGYAPAMNRLGSMIAARFGGCITFPLPTSNGMPVAQCTVADASLADPNFATPIPPCGNGGVPPCWRLEAKAACSGLSPQSVGITIDRGGQAPPPGTAPRASCVSG